MQVSLGDMIRSSLSGWVKEKGPDQDIVLSSRIRLARNLSGVPFPHRANDEQLRKIIRSVVKAGDGIKGVNLTTKDLAGLPPMDRQILVEKHLVSPDLVREPKGRAVVLSDDETVSVMINEEDHLRIQAILPGLQLEEALKLAQNTDDALETGLEYAFHEQAGYLTACPTNVGTGLRASVMVHLPALVATNQIGRVLSAVSHLGLAVRGLFGEGSEALGNVFQVSNQVTLGLKEEEVVSNLRGVTRQIIDHERAARQALFENAKLPIEDRTLRAFGVLSCARILTSQEAIRLLSDVRLGIDMGLINKVNPGIFNELLVAIQPAFLQKLMGREMDPEERDVSRASLVRECIRQM